jgi:hypothetical protein
MADKKPKVKVRVHIRDKQLERKAMEIPPKKPKTPGSGNSKNSGKK